jgi:addiction module RelE/StbE family toxin
MQILLSKRFKTAFSKQQSSIQENFFQRMNLFVNDPFEPQLRNHALTGEYAGLRSIDITGDVRAIYEQKDITIVFITIGTHTQLYK